MEASLSLPDTHNTVAVRASLAQEYLKVSRKDNFFSDMLIYFFLLFLQQLCKHGLKRSCLVAFASGYVDIVFLSNVLDKKIYITSQYTAHHQSFGAGGLFPLFVILCNWKSFLERMN